MADAPTGRRANRAGRPSLFNHRPTGASGPAIRVRLLSVGRFARLDPVRLKRAKSLSAQRMVRFRRPTGVGSRPGGS
jgi:hypothetical protein